jgi:hypothetical protein
MSKVRDERDPRQSLDADAVVSCLTNHWTGVGKMITRVGEEEDREKTAF